MSSSGRACQCDRENQAGSPPLVSVLSAAVAPVAVGDVAATVA